MGHPAVSIPEKIFFKIGEVCDIVDVQPHVLRYWETEFSMLSPQKNRSGQRSYRRRDVEIALRIKELLYEELYTIAGAKKRLQSELREASKLKVVPGGPDPDELYAENRLAPDDDDEIGLELDAEEPEVEDPAPEKPVRRASKQEAIEQLANHLMELREILGSRKS